MLSRFYYDNYLIRAAKRFAVLIPGVVGAYFAVKDVFPAFDARVPLVLALFLTYVAAAYVLIPALVRLYRIFIREKHIPTYCVTPDGFASDPINIGVIATRRELIETMQKAGWYRADNRTPRTLLRMGLSMLFSRSYPSAPFSTLFLFGRKQDIGFQQPYGDDPQHRHHVRFWATTFADSSDHKEHLFFWQKYRGTKAPHRVLWVGAASLDKGIGVIRHNLQLTHMIEANTDDERELIVRQLKATGLVRQVRVERIDSPYRLINRVWRGQLKADGRIKICELKS
jgi:hypothetical protein